MSSPAAKLIVFFGKLTDRADRYHRRRRLLLRGFLRLELGLGKILQRLQQLIGGLVAAPQVGTHGLHGDRFQLLRNVGNNVPGHDRLGIHVFDGNLTNTVPLIGLFAGEHLIHHNAQRIDVAAGIGQFAPGLLRRNVMNGADGLAVLLMHLIFQGGNAEIADLDGAVLQKHDVLGLDVPVNDTPLMSVGQGLGHLFCEMQGFPPGHGAPLIHILS